MVAHSRTPLRPDRLRALNRPEPVSVVCDGRGLPTAARVRGRKHRIDAVWDRWRLDDEWWRRPIHRMYYLVELEEGRLETFFRDLADGGWYRQRERVERNGAPGDRRVR